MKIACFGLSSNPPHLGHLTVAKNLLKTKLVDQVWLIPCWRHSFGKKLAGSSHRWKMVKMMERPPKIRASDVEFRRKGTSYTIDTVKILKQKYPGYYFFWLIGSDIVKDQSYVKWKDWPLLKDLIKFLVVQRPGYEITENPLPSSFIFISVKAPDISAAEIRRRLKEGLSVKKLTTPEIIRYISKNKLYR